MKQRLMSVIFMLVLDKAMSNSLELGELRQRAV